MDLTGKQFKYIHGLTGQLCQVLSDDGTTITFTALEGVGAGKQLQDTKEHLLTRVRFTDERPTVFIPNDVATLTDEQLVDRLREIRAQRASVGRSVKTLTSRRIKRSTDAKLKAGDLGTILALALSVDIPSTEPEPTSPAPIKEEGEPS